MHVQVSTKLHVQRQKQTYKQNQRSEKKITPHLQLPPREVKQEGLFTYFCVLFKFSFNLHVIPMSLFEIENKPNPK